MIGFSDVLLLAIITISFSVVLQKDGPSVVLSLDSSNLSKGKNAGK